MDDFPARGTFYVSYKVASEFALKWSKYESESGFLFKKVRTKLEQNKARDELQKYSKVILKEYFFRLFCIWQFFRSARVQPRSYFFLPSEPLVSYSHFLNKKCVLICVFLIKKVYLYACFWWYQPLPFSSSIYIYFLLKRGTLYHNQQRFHV